MATSVELSDGYKMPVIGLGTYLSKKNEVGEAVKYAIEVGYRHIDTAYTYLNEEEIGRAIKEKIDDGTVKRRDLFVVTKLWSTFHEPDKVEYACRLSLKKLGLDYIDLYLMHIPIGFNHTDDDTLISINHEAGPFNDADYLDTWKAMEKLVKLGLVRSIGVSNFNTEQIERVVKNSEIMPVTNQVECHPGFNQKKLNNFCKKYDIILTAYRPLGCPNMSEKTPNYLFDENVKKIADKYGKVPSQVVLRYMIDIGTVPIPKSVTKERIKQNFEIFDFKLTKDDMKVLDSYNTGERQVLLPEIKDHKYYPFNIPY